MNKIKPLDQDILIGANTHNHAAKVVNKFGSQDSILYKLKEFSSGSFPHPYWILEDPTKEIFVTDSMTSSC